MKKIIVIGCPGSGKSTFAEKMHKITKIPIFHLDMMYWNPDKTTVEKKLFIERLSNVLSKDEWIVDGNYFSTMEMRIEACDTVVFLDYQIDVCLAGIEERRGKPRKDMPWIETEEDEEFVEFVKKFNDNIRPQIVELLRKHSDKNIIVFADRVQSESFLRMNFCEKVNQSNE